MVKYNYAFFNKTGTKGDIKIIKDDNAANEVIIQLLII
jgi:hypothetical protein